jgi:hypothetical protein
MDSLENRIAKLPAWVRMHIQKLENSISEQRDNINVLESANAENSSGKIRVNVGLTTKGIREDVWLPDHSVIEFNFGEHTTIRMNAGIDDPIVQVYSHPGLLHVLPRSGNAIHLVNENAFERRKLGDQ